MANVVAAVLHHGAKPRIINPGKAIHCWMIDTCERFHAYQTTK